MIWIRVIFIFNVLWMSGCATGKSAYKGKNEPATMMDVYLSGTGQAQKDVSVFIESNLREEKTYGYVKPYIPVVNDPVVRKVWIPDHKAQDNSDVMIAGHWVYVMVQPPTWFIDGKTVDTKLPIIVPSLGDSNQESSLGGAK